MEDAAAGGVCHVPGAVDHGADLGGDEVTGVYYCQACEIDHDIHDHGIVHKAPKDSEFVCEIPKEAGDLVDTCVYKDQLIVACQYGVFRLENNVLIQIKFKHE